MKISREQATFSIYRFEYERFYATLDVINAQFFFLFQVSTHSRSFFPLFFFCLCVV